MDDRNEQLPFLPYAGTSGWSGSETSRERAETADESGETSERQRMTMFLIRKAKNDGITWKELSCLTDWHHGTASGVLSVLHKGGHICRLTERRHRCQIYVMPEHVQGRETAAYKPNNANEEVAELREALAEAYRKLEAAEKRCAQQAQTIRELYAR